MFVIMGALPLLALKMRAVRRTTFWADASGSGERRLGLRPAVRTVIRTAKPTFPGRPPSAPPPSPPPPPPHPGAGGGDASTEMVGELQRLAAMHRAGELTDEEFAIAKQHVLRAP
jgi:hypothetical protein